MSDTNDKSGNSEQDDIDALLEGALGELTGDMDDDSGSAMDFDIDDILQAAGIDSPSADDGDGSASDFDIDDILRAADLPADSGAQGGLEDDASDFDIDDILNATAEATAATPATPVSAAPTQGDDLDIDALIDGMADGTADTGMPAPAAPVVQASAPTTDSKIILSGSSLPAIVPKPPETKAAPAPMPTDAAASETPATTQDDIDSLFETSASLDESEPSAHVPSPHIDTSQLDIDDIMASMDLADIEPAHAAPEIDLLVAGEDDSLQAGPDELADVEEADANADIEIAFVEEDAGGDSLLDDISATGAQPASPPVDDMMADIGLLETDAADDDAGDGLETLDISLAMGDLAAEADTDTDTDAEAAMQEAAVEPEAPEEIEELAAAEAEVEIPTLTEVAMTGAAYRAAVAGQAGQTGGDDMHAMLSAAASQAVQQALQDAAPAIEKAVLEQLQNRLPSLLQQAMQDQANRGA